MHNRNDGHSIPHRYAGKPARASHDRALPVDGEALRTGISGTNAGLETLFQTLENCNPNPEQLCLLKRLDNTLVSARHREIVNGSKGEWELLRLSADLFVRSSNISCERPASFPISGEGLIEFHFRLSGRLSLSGSAGTGAPMEVDRGSLLIWRQPSGCNVTGRLDTDERESSVTIYMRPGALERYFGDYAQSLPEGLAERLCGDGGSLFALRLNLIPRLAHLVHELATLNASGSKRLVQAEALVMLILCEVMGMLEEAPHDDVAECRMTDTDVRCLRHARAILQERYAAPPTIESLAREVGLGTTKLKNGFKGLFGTTISQFANDIRMDRARELLCKPDMPISQVAEILGYEYQNSFTAAFRRHFGVLPKDCRRDPWIVRPIWSAGQVQ